MERYTFNVKTYETFLDYLTEKNSTSSEEEYLDIHYMGYAMYFIYETLFWSGHFESLCGASSDWEGTKIMKNVVDFLEGVEKTEQFDEEQTMVVLTILRKVNTENLKSLKSANERSMNSYAQYNLQMKETGLEYLLELFVNTLRMRLDEDDSVWNEFRLQRMFSE